MRMPRDSELVPVLLHSPCRKEICGRRDNAAVVMIVIVDLNRSVVRSVLIRKIMNDGYDALLRDVEYLTLTFDSRCDRYQSAEPVIYRFSFFGF